VGYRQSPHAKAQPLAITNPPQQTQVQTCYSALTIEKTFPNITPSQKIS